MKKINFHDEHTLPHLHEQTTRFVSQVLFGREDAFGPCSSMAVVEGNALVGATIFHNYHTKDGVVELSSFGANPSWLSPRVIRAMFGYPFEGLGCQMVVLRVSDRNDTMNSIASRFGFTATHIPRMRGRDEGEFIHTMTDDQWKAHRLYRPFSLG